MKPGPAALTVTVGSDPRCSPTPTVWPSAAGLVARVETASQRQPETGIHRGRPVVAGRADDLQVAYHAVRFWRIAKERVPRYPLDGRGVPQRSRVGERWAGNTAQSSRFWTVYKHPRSYNEAVDMLLGCKMSRLATQRQLSGRA